MAHGHQLCGELPLYRIIWINHDHLMRFVGRPTLGLIWINFAHLFMVWFLPFATAWVARTRLASSPVAFYAGLFVCIDIAYNVFEREVLAHADMTQVSAYARRIARRRSLVVLATFTTAMLVCIHRAALQLRPDMHRPDSPLTARCLGQYPVAVSRARKDGELTVCVRSIAGGGNELKDFAGCAHESEDEQTDQCSS